MRQFRLTIILFILCLALGVYVWFFERGAVSGPRLWKVNARRVQRIELTSGDKTTVVERRGRSWRITRPISARVDAERMKQLLERVAAIEVQRRLGETKDLKAYGLDDPAASITLTLAGAGTRRLLLGDKTPDSSAVYAMESEAKRVVLVSTALLDDAIGGADSLRDRSALPFERDQVQRIVLRRPAGRVALAKQRKAWRIVEPIAAGADATAVSDLLTALEEMEASRFVAERAPDPARYGLAAPGLIIELGLTRGKALRRLTFGAKTETGEYYARNSLDGTVMAIAQTQFDRVNKTLTDLRSKQVAPIAVGQVQRIVIARGEQRFELRRAGEERWELKSPRRLEADAQQVDDLLWDLYDLRTEAFEDHPRPLADYGLDPPRAAVTVYQERRKEPVRILLGKPAAPNRIYAKGKETTVYQVAADILQRLPATADSLRNLALLDYAPGEITRLRATYDGKSIALERDNTHWRLTQPRRGRAKPERVEDLLRVVEQVRAEQFVAEAKAADLPRYGLQDPAVRLTVHGGEGAPRTLLVGRAGDQTYLQLEGDSAVFRAASGFLKDLTDRLNSAARKAD